MTVPKRGAAIAASLAAPDPRRLTTLRRRFPTIADLRDVARRRVPSFGFEYVDGGVGHGDPNAARNAAAMDAVELVPRYGGDDGSIATDVELFGERYALPIGVAPMGVPGLMWPGGEEHLARAAQAANVPFQLSTSSGAIERAAELASNVFWFQLYRVARDDFAITYDLVGRAEAAGAHVLVLTLDVPARAKRPRELRTGLTAPFRPDLRTILELARRPAWLVAFLQFGQPGFANFPRYVPGHPTHHLVAKYVRREVGGTFSWVEVARLRERWPRALVVNGIMHPRDAERAVSLGADGVQVSNHGGRQFEAAPASIDVLPAIVATVGSRATILYDGAVRSGVDILRALALGAKAVFAGRPFMYGLGALGAEGPDYVMDFYREELREAMRQCGVATLAETRSLSFRHSGAFRFTAAERTT
ncbi:MAG: alpha-hydroxy acid oxidase [Alphaproteobacteria bacterium]